MWVITSHARQWSWLLIRVKTPVLPRTKGQLYRKLFYAMASSCSKQASLGQVETVKDMCHIRSFRHFKEQCFCPSVVAKAALSKSRRTPFMSEIKYRFVTLLIYQMIDQPLWANSIFYINVDVREIKVYMIFTYSRRSGNPTLTKPNTLVNCTQISNF